MRPIPAEPHVYWAPNPPATVGGADDDILYRLVGRCLTKYEHIEEEWALLFTIFTDAESEAAYRAYGSIVSYSTKREMLTNAAEIYFEEHSIPAVHRDNFDLLLKHYQKSSERRNEIAHGMVIGFIADKALQFFLVPANYSARKVGAVTTTQVPPLPKSSVAFRRAKYHYVAEDLEHFDFLFQEFRSFVHEYRTFLQNSYYQVP